jgi:hypothetical protein
VRDHVGKSDRLERLSGWASRIMSWLLRGA